MRLQANPYLPDDLPGLVRQLDTLYRQIATQLNQSSEGLISAVTNANTAAPVAGTWTQGDFVRNSQPGELGVMGSKYLVFGWSCVASGTPGTWVPLRLSTGN